MPTLCTESLCYIFYFDISSALCFKNIIEFVVNKSNRHGDGRIVVILCHSLRAGAINRAYRPSARGLAVVLNERRYSVFC